MTDPSRAHQIVWTPEKVATLWGYYATNRAYDVQYFSYYYGYSVLRFAQKHIPLSGRRVLDFGCGPGFMIDHLLREGISCEGLDSSAEVVAVLKKRFDGHPLFRGVIEGTSSTIAPLDDASVDVVLFVEVVEHLLAEQFLPTLKDIVRILRPGGHAVVTVPNDENLEASKVMCPECKCIFHRWQHQNSFNTNTLSAAMEQVGFTRVACQSMMLGPQRLKVIRRLYHALRQTPGRSPHLVYIGRKA